MLLTKFVQCLCLTVVFLLSYLLVFDNAWMQGTTYVYATFLRPFVAQHEPDIDRNLNELRIRAGDVALVWWQRGSVYAQARFYELLQYVASQSNRPQSTIAPPIRPQHPPQNPPQAPPRESNQVPKRVPPQVCVSHCLTIQECYIGTVGYLSIGPSSILFRLTSIMHMKICFGCYRMVESFFSFGL
jgi:hypothetical protein